MTVYRRGMTWVAGLLVLVAMAWTGEAWARKDALLDVTGGQIPDDTGSDGATKMTIDDNAQLGGKALKVIFAPGDSFGVRSSKVRNWKPYITVEFDVSNPEKSDIRLQFCVRHKRTTSYQTRVEHSFIVKPGKNSIKIGLDELTNVNGSAPDLSDAQRWYINPAEGKSPTLYFGDIFLVGDDPAPVAAPAAGGPGAVDLRGPFRVTGKIGSMDVDLKVERVAGSAPALGGKSSKAVATDPDRLARIRAAPMPPITRPVMFDTPEADAILAALEVYPPDNPWNQLVEEWQVHPNSSKIIASIGANKPFRYNADMAFVLVPSDQKPIELKKLDCVAESDKGPYPIPDNLPIEGWPQGYPGLTLDDVQRDRTNIGGDRHGIIVDPRNRMLYEFWLTKKVAGGWVANQASIFDLKSNKLRPNGWTSADAAGLPIFPAVVRYDELKRGVIDHALRVTVVKTRRDFVAPATHYASPHTNEEYPRMGERIRLRRDFDTSSFSPAAQVILKALKRYGMFVADNGIDWAISVAPDPRIPNMAEEMRKVKGSAFEVVTPP
jgi:hypothetical protein